MPILSAFVELTLDELGVRQGHKDLVRRVPLVVGESVRYVCPLCERMDGRVTLHLELLTLVDLPPIGAWRIYVYVQQVLAVGFLPAVI